MGDRTLTEFLADIDYGLGDVDGRGLATSLKTRWLNTAYMTLTTKKRIPGVKRNVYFPELEVEDSSQSWVDGSYRLTTPLNALIVRGIWDTTSDKYLTRFPSIRAYWKKKDRQSNDSESAPRQWIRHESYLYTYPQADDTYAATIFHRKRPALLESGVTDTTAIGSEWDEALYLLTMVQVHEKLSEFDKMQVKKKQFIEYVHDIIGIYDEEAQDQKRIFRPEITYIDGFKYRG